MVDSIYYFKFRGGALVGCLVKKKDLEQKVLQHANFCLNLKVSGINTAKIAGKNLIRKN